MRRFLLELCFLATLVLPFAGGAGCSNGGSGGDTGSAGRGGGSAGSGGRAGVGGGVAGEGGSAAGGDGGSTGTGGAGDATGTGGTTDQSPEQIHDSLLNAQTTGGIEVTRDQPTFTPPACQ